MDNIGPYISLAELLLAMSRSGAATGSKISLSNKTGNQFDFSPTDPIPEIGDWIIQNSEAQLISAVTSPQLEVQDATNLIDGLGSLIKSQLMENELNSVIQESMDFIDIHTGQFFNRRDFDDINPFSFEGNNADTILFRVPILEVQKLFLNNRKDELPKTHYKAFINRTIPDDRRNPKIKLLSETDDVLFNDTSLFLRNKFSRIVGGFGFLEADGSTPLRIQKATTRFAVLRILSEINQLSGGVSIDLSKGPIKREKTDLHEIEYFKPSEGKRLVGGNGPSGDDFIDIVLAEFRAPTTIGGSFADIFHEAPRINSFGRGR